MVPTMPSRKKLPQPTDQLTVRFPQGILERLRKKAIDNDRSLNAEIIHGLRHWLADMDDLQGEPHAPRQSTKR